MTRAKIMSGAAVLSAGQALGQALALGRSAIIARALSPDDVGIAAILTLVFSLGEMATYLATDVILVQSPRGDAPAMQRTVHALRLGRGVMLGLATALLAWPLTHALHIPQAAGAMLWMSLTPVLGGLLHADTDRLQRELRYSQEMWTEVISQLLTALLAWPVARACGDFSAVVWLMLIKYGSASLLSHALARRPYRVGWDADHAREIARFGWPLLSNGAIMFAVSYGDQAIIAAGYKAHEVGAYALAALLASAPTLIFSKVFASLALPVLARTARDPRRFFRFYRLGTGILALISSAIALGFCLLGPWLITTIFGAHHARSGELVGCLGLAHAVRLLRSAPNTAAIALGNTRLPLLANVLRGAVLLLALGAAAVRADIGWIAACALAGETLALALSVVRLRTIGSALPRDERPPAGVPPEAICA